MLQRFRKNINLPTICSIVLIFVCLSDATAKEPTQKQISECHENINSNLSPQLKNYCRHTCNRFADLVAFNVKDGYPPYAHASPHFLKQKEAGQTHFQYTDILQFMMEEDLQTSGTTHPMLSVKLECVSGEVITEMSTFYTPSSMDNSLPAGITNAKTQGLEYRHQTSGPAFIDLEVVENGNPDKKDEIENGFVLSIRGLSAQQMLFMDRTIDIDHPGWVKYFSSMLGMQLQMGENHVRFDARTDRSAHLEFNLKLDANISDNFQPTVHGYRFSGTAKRRLEYLNQNAKQRSEDLQKGQEEHKSRNQREGEAAEPKEDKGNEVVTNTNVAELRLFEDFIEKDVDTGKYKFMGDLKALLHELRDAMTNSSNYVYAQFYIDPAEKGDLKNAYMQEVTVDCSAQITN